MLHVHQNDPMTLFLWYIVDSVNVSLGVKFQVMCIFYSKVRRQNILKVNKNWKKSKMSLVFFCFIDVYMWTHSQWVCATHISNKLPATKMLFDSTRTPPKSPVVKLSSRKHKTLFTIYPVILWIFYINYV